MNGTELLPCPFCGEAAYFERHGSNRKSCIVSCQSCGCSLETGETGHDCGGMWNTRASGQCQPAMPADAEDAARYRWLRNSDPETDAAAESIYEDWLVGDDLDAAIDARRRIEGDEE